MIATGRTVKCTAHNGEHTGLVVAHLGADYGVAWTGSVRVPKTAEEKALMRALAKDGLMAVNADAIQEA